MPLVMEVSNDSYSSMLVSKESPITVTRKSEKLELQSEGINLCFIEKHGIETENEGFISDTSNGDMNIFGKASSFQQQLYVPVIQEIDSQDVADSCKNLLECNSGHNSVTDLVNADVCGNFVTSDSCFTCEFFARLTLLLII